MGIKSRVLVRGLAARAGHDAHLIRVENEESFIGVPGETVVGEKAKDGDILRSLQDGQEKRQQGCVDVGEWGTRASGLAPGGKPRLHGRTGAETV
ncbi:MAG: hypothetical protein ACE5GH_00380 [Fidelibacterota bacterium]